MSVCQSASNNSVPTGRIFMKFDISWNLIFASFSKSVQKIQVPLKSVKNSGYFIWRPMFLFDHISLNSSQNEKCFRHNLYRKSKNTLCQIILFTKSCLLRGVVAQYCWVREATDDNMAYARCVLHTLGYRHTLRICDTYSFSMQQRLNDAPPRYGTRELPVSFNAIQACTNINTAYRCCSKTTFLYL